MNTKNKTQQKSQSIKTRPARKVTSEWYRSQNTRPKTFIAEFERTSDGFYRVVQASAINKVNQFVSDFQRVDARDFTADILRGEVYCR